MTERQAWLYMARLWDNPMLSSLFGAEGAEVRVGAHYCRGLCGVIGCLYRSKQISDEVHLSMTKKVVRIEKVVRIASKRRKWGDYVWRMDERGARCRARFCRKMASECGRAR